VKIFEISLAYILLAIDTSRVFLARSLINDLLWSTS